MKRLALLSSLVLIGFASVVWSQSGQQPAPAPQPNPENFVGKVTGHPTTDIRMLRYSFEPGARTNWHSHEGGQVILIEKGTARVQEAGAAMREIGPRESVVTAPGVKHWHGAMPNDPLTQVSLSFGATNWMEKVSDAQYPGVRASEKTALCQLPTPNTQPPTDRGGVAKPWELEIGNWEFTGVGSHRRRLVTDLCPCPIVWRSDLQTPLRRVSRATCRWQDTSRRHAAEHAELAHPAHARLRRDDDDRVSVESRRAGGCRAFPG